MSDEAHSLLAVSVSAASIPMGYRFECCLLSLLAAVRYRLKTPYRNGSITVKIDTQYCDRYAPVSTGAQYLRIDAFAFFSYVVLFLSTAVLQSMKQPMFPMLLGIARQVVIPVSINVLLIVCISAIP